MVEDKVAGSGVAGSKVASSPFELPKGADSPFELPGAIVSKAPPKPKRQVKSKGVEPLLTESVQMYRAKILLAKGRRMIARGALTDLRWLDAAGKQRLVSIGAVRKVISPPLAELAGWKTRAKRLMPLGVNTIADFLFLPAAKLGQVLRVKEKTVIGWQDQLHEWSQMMEPPRR